MKKNWLTLYGETFLWVKGKKGLLYNTRNGVFFHFVNEGEIERVCEALLEIDNLYSVSISNAQLQNGDIAVWIDAIVIKGMGYITTETTFEERPISLMPVLKIQDDVQRYIWEKNRGIQGAVLNNLHEILFYINGTANGEDSLCKQVTYPLKTNDFLDYQEIVDFCHNSMNPYLTTVCLIGSLFDYPSYSKLLDKLEQLYIQLVIIIVDADYLCNIQAYNDIAKRKYFTVRIMVRDINSIKKLLDNQENLNLSYYFLVASEVEYGRVLEVVEGHNTNLDYQIIPIVRDDLDFFKTLVYIDEKAFAETLLSKQEVFARQSINLNDFGRLTVLPDGCVYSNVNRDSLGTIKDLPIEIVYKEFIKGESWLNVRKKEPCCNCIYQWLCPSPSNYELVIGKNNLCLV